MHFSGKEKRAQRLDSLLFTGGPILIHALRMERDKDILEMLGYISIRAPAQGATVMVDKSCREGQIFSHRSSAFPFQFPHPRWGAIFATEAFLW